MYVTCSHLYSLWVEPGSDMMQQINHLALLPLVTKKGLHTPAPSEDASLLCHNLLHYQQRAGEESEEWAVKLGKWPPSPHAAKEKAFGLTCKVFRKKRIHSFPVCSSWKIYALNPVVRGSGFGEWLIGSKPHLVAQTENTPRRCPWRIRGREASKDSFNTGKGNGKQKLPMLKAFLYPL